MYTLHKGNIYVISEQLDYLLFNKRLLVSELSKYDHHINTHYEEMKSKIFLNTDFTCITIPIGLGINLPIENQTTIDIFGDIVTIRRYVPHWGDIHTQVAYFPHYISITALRSLDA